MMEACPVCTLFLREGISLREHLQTHPKEQVIDALIRSQAQPLQYTSAIQQQHKTAALAVQTVSYQQIMAPTGTQYLTVAAVADQPPCPAPTSFNPLYNPYIPQPYPFIHNQHETFSVMERPKSVGSDDMDISGSDRESRSSCSPIATRSLPSSLSTSLSASVPPSPIENETPGEEEDLEPEVQEQNEEEKDKEQVEEGQQTPPRSPVIVPSPPPLMSHSAASQFRDEIEHFKINEEDEDVEDININNIEHTSYKKQLLERGHGEQDTGFLKESNDDDFNNEYDDCANDERYQRDGEDEYLSIKPSSNPSLLPPLMPVMQLVNNDDDFVEHTATYTDLMPPQSPPQLAPPRLPLQQPTVHQNFGDMNNNHNSNSSFMELGSLRIFFGESSSATAVNNFNNNNNQSASVPVIQLSSDTKQQPSPILNIIADESMPAHGELSEQESLGVDSAWDMFQRDVKPVPSAAAAAAAVAASSSSSSGNDSNSVDRKPFRCPFCPMVFNCPKERRVHKNTAHEALRLDTDQSHAASKQHICQQEQPVGQRQHHRVFLCPECGADFRTLRERRLHIAEVHLRTDAMAHSAISASVKSEPTTKLDVQTNLIPVAGSSGSSSSSSRVCSICNAPFLSVRQLRLHMREQHNMLRFKCETCSVGFDDDMKYHEHLHVHPLKCDTCDKTFVRRTALNLHRKRHLKIKPYECNICPKSFITRQKLDEHLNAHSGLKPIKCLLCDKAFTRHSNLIQHRNIHHRPGKRKVRDFVCRCGEIFHSQRKLEWHREIHEPKPKSCPYCSQKFIHAASVTRHVRRSHKPEYLPEPHLPVPLAPATEEKNCNNIDLPKQRFRYKFENVPCPVCGKLYLKTSLSVHLRVHNGDRPFQCPICSKRFSTKWNMESHMWTHQARSALPFKCSQCKSAFYRQVDYNSHMNSHKNVKPYVCNVCGQRFVRKYNCFRHQEEHKQVKKFACSVAGCGRTFHRSYYLKDHMKVHTGLRPHTCHMCGKTSSTKSNHNKHLRIHDQRDPINMEN